MGLPDNPLVNLARYGLEYIGFGRIIAPFPIRREAEPWSANAFAADPECTIAPPDYVGIGTQKSGTSWWASLIEQHPDVVPNRFMRKEMHYLAHFLEKEMSADEVATYHTAFARPRGKKCGEWTPNYMANPHAIQQLKVAAPEAKILVLIRNPVERYVSGFNHERKQRFGGVIGPSVRMKVLKQYALRTESIWNGMYGSQLEIVFDVFPRDQVLVLQYEACKANPDSRIRKTYEFLGLDPTFTPAGVTRQVNTQRRQGPTLDTEYREMLQRIYRSDVQRLVKLCPDEIDCTLWDGFSDCK